MAVRKGRMNVLNLSRGTVTPLNRALGPIGKGVIFELPEATSDVRTVARTTDVSAVVVHEVALSTDLGITIVALLDKAFDTGVISVRNVSAGVDVWLQVDHVLDLDSDAMMSIFRHIEQPFDCSLVVLHRLMSDADVKQRIYVFLLRESHVVQV
ncbi:MAG: hypothetical protein QHI38_11475 [Armatimonadota bacterium]|nr:hypothetical protein [Armatimonadota bacterium]